MRSAALVVTWRESSEALKALSSLAVMDLSPSLLICVAQELTVGDCERLHREAPSGTVVLEVPTNLGFPGAANLGLRYAAEAEMDYTLLVNNDATVTSDCLRRCLEAFAGRSRVAVVGPAVAFADFPDRLWYGGGRHSHLFGYTMHRALKKPAASPPPSGPTQYVPGCCALYSMRAWRAVGPFREDYFLYYEDAEWANRARARGWELFYLGRVLCHHAAGVASNQRGSLGLGEITAYYLARNPIRFALDSETTALRLSRLAGTMTVWNAYNAWRILRSRRAAVARAYLRGLMDAIRGRTGPAPP